MAFVRLKNNQNKTVSAEQGLLIWRIMNGEATGTPEQCAFVKNIKRIYLNRANAPASYLEAHPIPGAKQEQASLRLPYVD